MTDAPEALPPEVNSSLVHGGDGPLSLEQAALAFAEAAADDAANAQTLMGIVAAVSAQWEGTAATQYSAALQPLIAWFEALAVNGAASAEQIQLAAASITEAIATAPHPTLVVENRTTWGVLASTNFFGVNTPAMEVQDTHYLEMWFQAAFARGTSDIETEVATTSLMPFQPPPIPVNLGAMGAPVSAAVSMASFTVPQGVANAADLGVSDVGWDTTLTSGAAGDGAGMAGSRPNSSWASEANETGNDQENQLQDASRQGSQDMSQFASQAGSMASQAASMPTQLLQSFQQQATQVPQQFSSILQPLMSSANLNNGLGGLGSGAGVPALPVNFASGTGNLSAALTRPASLFGGSGGSGGSGLRLPGSSLGAASAPELSAASAAGRAASGAGAAAGPGGTGFLGSPRPGSSSQTNSRNPYESNSLGLDHERAV